MQSSENKQQLLKIIKHKPAIDNELEDLKEKI